MAALVIATTSVAVVGPALAAGPSGSGTWTEHVYEADESADTREYFLYEPAPLPDGPAPLVVYLHGCGQTAGDAAVGTEWNLLADEQGVLVVYPQQSPGPGGNTLGCWNWVLPTHQQRGSGEPATIAGIVHEVARTHDIDADRVYVTGISAGGAMASVMGATHPDVFAAIGVLAGCGYASCTDVAGTAALAAMGERVRPMPVVIAHGLVDPIAPYALGVSARLQWLATNDLIDDGRPNGSVSLLPTTSTTVAGVRDDGGEATGDDLCLPPDQYPCLGAVLGLESYPHTIDVHPGTDGCELVQVWTIHGLGHAYSGGDPTGSHTDPRGPDMTTLTWDFFERHHLSGPTPAACPDRTAPTPPADVPAPTPSEEATSPTDGPEPGMTPTPDPVTDAPPAPLPATGGSTVVSAMCMLAGALALGSSPTRSRQAT